MTNGSEIYVESCSGIQKHVTIEVVLNDNLRNVSSLDVWSELPDEYRTVGTVSTKDEISNLLRSFLFVAESGGFDIEGGSASRKLIQNIVFHKTESKVLRVEYDVRDVSLESWNIFSNAMNSIFISTETVGKVSIYERRGDTCTNVFNVNSNDFPGVLRHIPFELRFDDPWDYRSMRRVLIVFESKISAGCFEELRRRVSAWSLLLEETGFSDDPSDEVIVEELEAVDDFSYEIVLPRFESSEKAWNPLINMLARFSATSALVNRLAIC